MQAGAGQRQLDMAQIAATVTATDALIGQQLGGKRLLTTCQRRRWRTPQRGDGGALRRPLQAFLGSGLGLIEPRRSNGIDVQVRRRAIEQAGGTQLDRKSTRLNSSH